MPEQPVNTTKAEEIALRLMRLLQACPDLSQRELAQQMGISLGALNYCLRALVAKGFVKLENFSQSPHKLRYAYILTPAGMAQKMVLTGQFLQRKLQAYELLRQEIEQLQAEHHKSDCDTFSVTK